MRPLDELTGGVQDPSASIVFWFCFPCFLSFSFSGSLFFCRVVARFLRRAVQVLDHLVASFAKPLALYWRLRRVGAADTGVPPLEGRGSGRCPTGTCSTLGHNSGSGGISAQNLVVIGLFGISAELEHCDRPVSVSGYLSSLSIERRRLRSTSCGP